MNPSTRNGPLTERQHFIIQQVINGLEHKEIAKLLGLTNRTSVTNEMRMIVAKLGVRNSSAAVALYSRWQACGLSEDDTAALDALSYATEGVAGAAAVRPTSQPQDSPKTAGRPIPHSLPSLPTEPPQPTFTGLFAEPPSTGYIADDEEN